MSKNISIDEVKKLAELAQIHFDDAEAEAMVAELDKILAYVKQLDSVDTSRVEPTSQVTGLKNVQRADEVIDYSHTREQLLANAPDQSGGQVRTKRVL